MSNESNEGEQNMTIEKIYAEFTAGYVGFVRAVRDNGGIDVSETEIKRIADRARTSSEFMQIWENEEWWTDANNGS